MRVKISKGTAYGQIAAPPSKSYGHRMLICAALANGKSTVKRISASEDMLATIDCIKALGVQAESEGDTCILGGFGAENITEKHCLPEYKCRESGSTLRFFIPIAMALTGGGIFSGAKRLIERGIGIYEELFVPQGVLIEKCEDFIRIEGTLKAGNMKVRGDVSSQFISGLLFALPLLKEDSTLEILPPVESRAYIDITIDSMKLFGVNVEEPATNHFFIKGGQSYKAKDVSVEGDWSNAAFLYAIKELTGAGDKLEITGLREDSIQGDKVCRDYFDKLIKGTEEALDISGCPDLGPILFAFAAAAKGGKFTGIRRLRIKESDRAAVMAQELAKFGVTAQVLENDMIIPAGQLKAPQEVIDGHNDHRIVMSMAVLMLLTGGGIEGAEAVKKSYPDFFNNLRDLGVSVQEL